MTGARVGAGEGDVGACAQDSMGRAWFHKALSIFSSAYSTHDTFLPLPCTIDIGKHLPMNGKYLEDRYCD